MMADERKPDEDEGEEGPGAVFKQFVLMENVLDKLKLLNYERDYCRELHMKPFSRHYFAIPTNPGEQFHAFTSVAAWLIRCCGGQMEQPQEYDDPNGTISTILDEVRQLGNRVDFPPSRLKSGHGDACISILHILTNEALKKKRFEWKMPEYPEEEMEEENVIEDESELNINKVEEAVVDYGSSDDDYIEDEENILDLEGLKRLRAGEEGESEEKNRPEEVMESTTDTSEWRLEVERVMPHLKVTIRNDNKDWRAHVDQMALHKTEISSYYKETKVHLDRLHDDIARTLEKISSREKYLNNQLEYLLSEYRATQDRLSETKERYKQASGGITERARSLAEITDELERIKMEMEERGSSMTDGTPLSRIKQAIQRLKSDIQQMDIRTGVLEHILLQAKLKAKTDSHRGFASNTDENYLY